MDPAAGPRVMGGIPWEPPWPGRPQPLPHHLQRGAAGTRQGGTPRRGSPHAGISAGGLAQRSKRASRRRAWDSAGWQVEAATGHVWLWALQWLGEEAENFI